VSITAVSARVRAFARGSLVGVESGVLIYVTLSDDLPYAMGLTDDLPVLVALTDDD
jgi:hypothetical protein